MRTWLLYLAGPDPASVTAAVRSAVRMAFAAQADYVPHVAVEADRGWDGYRSLYPSQAERRVLLDRLAKAVDTAAIAAATAATVAGLASADPTRPVKLAYRLSFPTAAVRSRFEALALATLFHVVPARARGRSADGFALELARDTVPELSAVRQVERWLVQETQAIGGRYLGCHGPAGTTPLAAAA